MLWSIRPRFHGLSSCNGHVAHALRTLAPVAGNVLLHPAAPRLACVKPAASVHPEPGSNSSLYILLIKLLAPALLFQLFFNKGIYALIINVNIYYTACLFNIFNELFPFLSSGLTALPFWDRKDTDFFVISKFFRNFFEKNFRFKTSEELYPSPLSFAGCKGRYYFLFCKLFLQKNQYFYSFNNIPII